jgi:hypothetical protein
MDRGLGDQGFETAASRALSLLYNVQTSYGAKPASYSMSMRFLSWCKSGQCAELTIYLRLLLRLRTRVAIPLLLFMPSWHGQEQLF